MYLKSILLTTLLMSGSTWAEENKVFICGSHWAEIELEYFEGRSQADAYFAGNSSWTRSHTPAIKVIAEENKYLFNFTDDQGGHLRIERKTSSSRWLGFVKETHSSNEYSIAFCEPTT